VRSLLLAGCHVGPRGQLRLLPYNRNRRVFLGVSRVAGATSPESPGGFGPLGEYKNAPTDPTMLPSFEAENPHLDRAENVRKGEFPPPRSIAC
jgi:hypothetical protein